jgi:hypothetical protein
VFRASFRDEAGKSMYRRQALVAAGDAALALLFEMPQELPDHLRVEIADHQIVYLSMKIACRIE